MRNRPSKIKIKKRKELARIVALCKKKRRRTVFTNGCFDIIHLGHIRYLEQAAALGDTLIVAVNSNSSVRKIKGLARPVMRAEERANLVAALACVDYVIIFAQATPLNLIKAFKPDVLVKGGDWRNRDIVGKKFVQSYGGRVVCADFLKGHSSSSIITKIKNK